MPFPVRNHRTTKGYNVKYIKMLGLSMVAAIAAMAFVGASSASAASTALCKANELPCSTANTYGIGTVIAAELESGTKAVLKSSLGNVECTISTVGGTTTTGLASPLKGNIEELTFEGCTLSGESCTAETVVGSLPYPASLSWIEGTMNGTMTVEKAKVHVVCGFIVNCTFGGTVTPLTVKGGAMGLVEAKEVKITLIEGGICPSEAKWTANYLVTSPEPLWVSS
jgi:hypothetical protein